MQPPDRPRIEQRSRQAQIVAIEIVLRDHDRAVGELFGQRKEGAALRLVGAGRLLAEELFPGRQHLARHRIEERDRQREQDGVDIVAAEELPVVLMMRAHADAGVLGKMRRVRR